MATNINGVLNLYKQPGMTSHTALIFTRRLFDRVKAGHCGTLDPNARGVLPILLGNAVKAAEFFADHDKSYVAELILGKATDTGDITGTVIGESDAPIPPFDAIRDVVRSFEGGYFQVPPMYSALKVNGQKLVDAARKGIVIEREPRKIDIYSIGLNEAGGRLFVSVECSKGTYMRTLCEDIGERLGMPACMGELERTRAGDFKKENSVTLDELERMDAENRAALVTPVEEALPRFGKIELNGFFAALIKNGLAVETGKLGIKETREGTLFRLYESENFFAVGEIVVRDGKICLKHKKLFT